MKKTRTTILILAATLLPMLFTSCTAIANSAWFKPTPYGVDPAIVKASPHQTRMRVERQVWRVDRQFRRLERLRR